jgi:hypothetical protein
MRLKSKRRTPIRLGLLGLLLALVPLGSAQASHGGWDVEQPAQVFDGCDDALRALLYGFDTAIAQGSSNKNTGSMGGYAAAGVNAVDFNGNHRTEPRVGTIVKPLPPPIDCVGLGGSEAEGAGNLRAVIPWPGAPSATRVRVVLSDVGINPSNLTLVQPTVTIPGLADVGWHLLAGIRVSYFPCPPNVPPGPCSPSSIVLQDVEDIARSDGPAGFPPSVELCVSDFLDTMAPGPGSLVVDATFSTFAVARGDALAIVEGFAKAAPPVAETGVCPSYPNESLTDGDSES